MNLDGHIDALTLAKKLVDEHYRPAVDIDKQDARLAAFHIARACVEQATRALATFAFGDLDAPRRAGRFIRECGLLVASLACLPEEARGRYARQFFRDGRITVDTRRYKKELGAGAGLSGNTLNEWLDEINELNRSFATGQREDFRSAARGIQVAQSMPNSSATRPAPGALRTFDFGDLVTAPTIEVVAVSSSLLGIDPDLLKRLSSLGKKREGPCAAG